jgi:hypothetical protein
LVYLGQVVSVVCRLRTGFSISQDDLGKTKRLVGLGAVYLGLVFPWLDKVGKQIHGLRIGATFRHAVHLYSEDVAQLINDGQTKTSAGGIADLDDSYANSIYDDFMKATNDKLSTLPQCGPPDLVALRRLLRKEEAYEIIPGPEGDIFSWAIVRIRPCPSLMQATKRSNDFTSVKSLADYHMCERPSIPVNSS